MATFNDLVRQSKNKMTKGLKKTNQEGARHPFNHPENHEKLKKYVFDRIDFGNQIREEFCRRIEEIDKQIFGFIKLDAGDKQRTQDNSRGEGPKPVKVNIQLTFTQLDEAVTYLMEVFAPDGEMYKALSSKDKQQIANAFSLVMNKHADKRQHYREMSKFVGNALRYNLGGLQVFWEKITGVKIANDETRKAVRKQATVFEGNAIKSLDMYNTIWDISVHPVDLPLFGEFVATVDRYTSFRVLKMEQDGEIYDVYKYLDSEIPHGKTYYRAKPQLRTIDPVSGASKNIDWFAYLSAGQNVSDVGKGIEFVNYVGWIKPHDFGLSDSKNLEVWRLVWAQGAFLTHAAHIDNGHGMLPFSFAAPNEDDLGLQQRSYGELLMPFQTFASHLFNTHIQGTRKELYGVTIYDPQVVDLSQLGDDVSARIPTKQTGQGVDLTKSIAHFQEGPETKGTMQDFAQVLDLMQKILPTQMLQQVADLQRATQHQSAATVQSANRRNHKIAKTIDDQALKNCRFMQMYNIFERQQAMKLLAKDGTEVDVNPAEFRETDIEFDISDGLRAIDKMTVITVMKEIINMILQSQQAIQEIDVIEFLNYFTSMLGDRYDLRRFKRQQLTPQQQAEQAGANKQNAEAAAILASDQGTPQGVTMQ
jgi:hypothetical protein